MLWSSGNDIGGAKFKDMNYDQCLWKGPSKTHGRGPEWCIMDWCPQLEAIMMKIIQNAPMALVTVTITVLTALPTILPVIETHIAGSVTNNGLAKIGESGLR
jgi:hypothetical protein